MADEIKPAAGSGPVSSEEKPAALAPTAAPASSQGGGGKALKVILIIIVLLVVVVGGGLFAYGKFVKKANSISEIFQPTKFDPNCKYNDPDLCKMINNWKNINYYTLTIEMTDKDNKKTNLTMKIDGEDKSQMIGADNGTENYNFINIGNTSYTKDFTDNAWFKITNLSNSNTNSGNLFDVDFDEEANLQGDNATYKKIGSEACGKLTCLKYQLIDSANPDYTEYIYFDTKEYLVRKTRTEGKDGSITEATFDYNKVTISEPSPIKEGAPYSTDSSVFQGLGNNSNSSVSNPDTNSSSDNFTVPDWGAETNPPAEEVPYGDEEGIPIE